MMGTAGVMGADGKRNVIDRDKESYNITPPLELFSSGKPSY